MRQLNGMYTQASNRRHRRTGHLFQGRFKATLVAIAAKYPERDDAIVAAYGTGSYSYRQIAEHFGVHLATVGRTVRKRMLQDEN